MNLWSPLTVLVEETADNEYYDFIHALQNKLEARKPGAKTNSPLAPSESKAMYGVLEMDKKIDEILLGFEEINSNIDRYLDDIGSDDDEKLAPLQRNRTIDHQKSSPIEKSNNVQNDSIQPTTLNPKIVSFSE